MNETLYSTPQAFASKMTDKLALVDGKPGKRGWDNDTKEELWDRLDAKVRALGGEMTPDSIRALCVDIGNYAMMIWDNAGRL